MCQLKSVQVFCLESYSVSQQPELLGTDAVYQAKVRVGRRDRVTANTLNIHYFFLKWIAKDNICYHITVVWWGIIHFFYFERYPAKEPLCCQSVDAIRLSQPWSALPPLTHSLQFTNITTVLLPLLAERKLSPHSTSVTLIQTAQWNERRKIPTLKAEWKGL